MENTPKDIAGALAAYVLAEQNKVAVIETLNKQVWATKSKIENLCKSGEIGNRCVVNIDGVEYLVTINFQPGGETYAERVYRYE